MKRRKNRERGTGKITLTDVEAKEIGKNEEEERERQIDRKNDREKTGTIKQVEKTNM